MAGFGFNTNDYADVQNSFDPVPAGDYQMRIDDSEIKVSQTGNQYLSVKFVITDAQCTNRVLFSNFNIMHPNIDTQRIAREQITLLCKAAGVPGANDSAQLHGRVVIGKVKCDPTKDFPNSIKGYKSLGNVQPVQSHQAVPAQQSMQTQPSQPSVTATSHSNKPWERKAS